jgi:O-antigen/teichoic acid export membrane protein
MFMVLFRTAYSLGIEPFFFSHASNENAQHTYATITKYFVIFGSFISLFVIVFADLLKQVLVPNDTYWDAMKVVPLIVLANFFLGIYTNLSVWYKLIDKTKIGAYISLIGAAITLILNWILIPTMSYYGSAIATIAAYGSMMIISYQLGQKNYPIPYEMNVILKYLGITILFSAISFYIPVLRENYLVKIVLLSLFLYFIYRNEKETLLKIIKRKNK